jgi:O-antigen/teichoic acid export membrane protein
MTVRAAAVWAMASQYGSFVIQFAVSVIISRFFLAPDEVGLFSIALAAAMLVAVLQDFGLSRYISGLPELTPEEIDRASSVAVIFSFVVTGLIAALAWPLAWLYDLPALGPLLLIIAGSYLFLPLSVVPLALMARQMRFSGHFAVNVGGSAANAAVALTLAWFGFSSFALAWAVLAMGLARGVIAQLLAPARCWPLRLDGLRPIVSFGGWTSALYITGALGSRSPDLVVGKLVGLTATGLFSRATSLADQVRMLIAGAIGGVFYPAFARIRDSGQPLGPAYLRVAAGYSAVVWPGMAGLALAAEPLVLLLYGETWAGVAPLLTWVALASALLVALPLVSELPILLGRIRTLLLLNLAETLVSIGLLVAGSLIAGAGGAAASRMGYAVLFVLIYLRFMHRLVGFDMRAFLLGHAKSALASLAAIAPLAAAYRWWAGPSEIGFVALMVSVAAGGLCWLVALTLVRHPVLADLRHLAAPPLRLLSPRLGAWIVPTEVVK